MADNAVVVSPSSPSTPQPGLSSSPGTPSASNLDASINAALALAASQNAAPAVVTPPAAPTFEVNAPIPTPPVLEPLTVPTLTAPVVAPIPGEPAPQLSPLDLLGDMAPEVTPAGKTIQGQPTSEKHTYTVPASQRLQAAAATLRAMTHIRPDLTVESFGHLSRKSDGTDNMFALYRSAINAATPEQQQLAQRNIDEILQAVFIDDTLDGQSKVGHIPFGLLTIRAQAKLIENLNNPDPNVSGPMRAAWNSLQNWHRNALKNDPALLDHGNAVLLRRLRDEIPQFQDIEARKQRVFLIQHLEKALNLEMSQADALMAWQPQHANADPLAARQADLDRREQAQRDRDASAAQQRDNERAQFMDQSRDSSIMDEINKYLAPWRAPNSAMSPQQTDFVANQLGQNIQSVANSNTDWTAQLASLRSRAHQSGAPEDVQAFTDYVRTVAKWIIALNGASITGPHAAAVMSSNAARTQSANGRHNQPAPNGPGTPAGPNGLKQMLKADNWKDMWTASGLS